jgi:carbon storage regulator CsrA
MLVLTRRPNETIVLPGPGVTMRLLSVRNNSVRVGIEAPADVTVLRGEVQDRQQQWMTPPDASAPVRGLANRRVETARKGLAEAQRLLAAGRTVEAAETLNRIDEDLALLERRLGGTPATHASGGSQRALVVEDNANERELLALFLRNAGLDVDTAADGADALNYLHTHSRPDFVLLDMGLPRCDGASMVRQVREDPAYAGMKIFAISGHTPDEFSLDRGPAGVDRWFNKPVDPADVVRGMRQDLEKSFTRLR